MSSNGSRPDLERELRKILLGLALTMNGTVARMDRDRDGGQRRHYSDSMLVGALGRGDAPHLIYAERYEHAEDDAARRRVIDEARQELEHIHKSSGRVTRDETQEELHARIVREGAGWEARDVAIALRTSEAVVRRARRDAHRDEDLGHQVVNGHELSADRRAERIHELADRGMDARAIARAMGLSYSTIRRALGRM